MSDANQLTLNHDASCSCTEQLTANLVGKCRTEEVGGVKYLVAKIAALNPGVLNGSRGPLLYTPEDTRKATKSWNQIPLVVYHPTDDSGKPISANTDGVVHVGFTKNAKYGGKLTVEGWFDVEKTKATDSRVYDALVNGTPMEVSTGLGTTNEEAPAGASYLGQLYSHIARDHRPDHLAILPDQRGACSINDGCGLHVNQQGEKMETVTISVDKTTLRDAVANAVQTVVDSIQIESLCTNCGDDGECAECKAKKLKKMKMAEEPVENGIKEAKKLLDDAIALHVKHMDGTAPTTGKDGEKSQMEMMDQMKSARKELEITTNELSHDDLRQRLNTLLNEKYGTPGLSAYGVPSPVATASNLYVTDVYDKDFVYQDGAELYRLGYSTDLRSDTVTLSEDAPKRVTKVSTYQPVQNRELLTRVGETLNCGGEGGTPGPCATTAPGQSGWNKKNTRGGLGKGPYRVMSGSKIVFKSKDEAAAIEFAKSHAQESGQMVAVHYVGKGSSSPISHQYPKTTNQSRSSRSGLLNLVANSSDLTRGEPDMAGKLTDADRLKLVEGLTTNSGFEVADIWGEDDVEVLNAMSDEKLFKAALAKQTLIDQQMVVNQVSQITGERKVENMASAIQNAFKPFKKKAKMEDDEEMEDEDMEEEEEVVNTLRVPRQMTEAEFMKMAPPSIRADLEFSRATQNREKQELIGQITANVSGEELDQAVNYLKTKQLPELRIIANVAMKPAAPDFDFSTRRSPNYGGQGIPTINHGRKGKVGEGPKPVTINWAEDVQKHQVG